MAAEGTDRWIQTLATYVDALESARAALEADGTSAGFIFSVGTFNG